MVSLPESQRGSGTGVWIIGDGENLPFRKIFTNAPGPKHITKDKGGVTNENEDQEGNPGSVSRRTVANWPRRRPSSEIRPLAVDGCACSYRSPASPQPHFGVFRRGTTAPEDFGLDGEHVAVV